MQWPASMTLSSADRPGRWTRRCRCGRRLAILVAAILATAHPLSAQVIGGPAGAINAGTGAVRNAPRGTSPTVPLGTQVPGARELRTVSVVGIAQQALSPRTFMPVDMVLQAQSPIWLTQLFCPANDIERCQNPQLRRDFRRRPTIAPDWQELPVLPAVLSQLYPSVQTPRCYVVVWKDDQNRTVQSLPFTLQQGISNANSVCR
jgi:hypothetical protein